MAQTILVVDDDPVQRRLLETAIGRSGMQVVTAPGGQPALDLIHGPRGEQITLVLLDLVMPDMGGLEVLEKLRPTHPELPVIVLTAKGGIDSCSAMRRAPSPAPATSIWANSRKPMAAPCSWTRSANCAWTCRSSCCARCRKAKSIRSVPSGR
jgi:CheY-like chemotaxis protein